MVGKTLRTLCGLVAWKKEETWTKQIKIMAKDLFKTSGLRDAISEADDAQSAESLANELRECKGEVAQLNEELRHLSDASASLLPYISKSIEEMRKASAFTIPMETIEKQCQVYNVFVEHFSEMLDKRTQAADKRLTNHEAKLEEQAKRLTNLGNRIALPSTLLYILIIALLFLSIFFGAVWYANTVTIHNPSLSNLCCCFLGCTILSIAAIIGINHWLKRL